MRVRRDGGEVRVVVADDGNGGAIVGGGTGLRGLIDRLAVLDGRLEVDSPPGHGTRLEAHIPCGQPRLARLPRPRRGGARA